MRALPLLLLVLAGCATAPLTVRVDGVPVACPAVVYRSCESRVLDVSPGRSCACAPRQDAVVVLTQVSATLAPPAPSPLITPDGR